MSTLHAPYYFPHILIWAISSILLLLGMRRYRHNRIVLLIMMLVECWMTAGLIATPVRIAIHIPRPVGLFARAGLVIGAFCTFFSMLIELFWAMVPQFNPKRRAVLKAASFAAPMLALGAGYLKREELRLTEIDVPIPNLPKDLQGLRIVQLSDLHLSPLVSEAFIARAVDMANTTRAHIALVTGDLISSMGDPLEDCVRQVSRLRADAGVFGCLGNHEVYARCESYATELAGRVGIPLLRSETRLLRFGNAALNLAGVDYQPRHLPYLVGAEKLTVPGATNVLLSHNPDVFPVAAGKGFDLTIAGHTHGGQINVEILHEDLNIVRFFTPFIYGVYRHNGATAFVTRGIGTIGIPSRLGAPPEVALLRLCATSS